MEALVLLLLIAVGGFFYFLPTIVGWKKRNVTAIFMLNLFLGWSLIGWVVALVWATTKDQSSPGQSLPGGAASELEKLVGLRSQGVLTDQEFNRAKERLLGATGAAPGSHWQVENDPAEVAQSAPGSGWQSKVIAASVAAVLVVIVGAVMYQQKQPIESQLTEEDIMPVSMEAAVLVENDSNDKSVSQVKQYLIRILEGAKNYEPVEWFPVKKTGSDDYMYMVRHRFRAVGSPKPKKIHNWVFYLNGKGEVVKTITQD